MTAGEVKVEQRTEEWHKARAGKITASRMCDVMAFSKRDGKPLNARGDYLIELATERLTGKSMGTPMSAQMQWGVDVEPAARAAYEARYAVIVETPGFIVMDNGFIGCSPDGVLNTDIPLGGLELKCPYKSKVHVETLLTGMPEEHMPQVQASMMVTDRTWWDFGSYDPRFTGDAAPLALYVQRIPRDDGYVAHMLQLCTDLNAEVDALVAKLRARMKPQKALP